MTRPHRAAALLIALAVLAGLAGAWLLRAAGRDRVIWLGDAAHEAEILALSADGRVAAGMLYDAGKAPNNYMHGFVWSRPRGLQLIRTRDGGDTYVESISADGKTVVGRFYDRARAAHLYRWTRAGGVEDLGAPENLDPAIGSRCGDRGAIVSADGSVILGRLKQGAGNFRWTRQTGFRTLALPGAITAATPDGGVIVGLTDSAPTHVFRWSAAGGFEDLGAPTGAAEFGYVTVEAVSADGGAIVGTYMAPTPEPERGDIRGYRWSRAGGFQDLPGGDALVCGLSGDGSQVVGQVGEKAVRWAGAAGPLPVGPPDLDAVSAVSLSADGRTVAGQARQNDGRVQGFVFRGSRTP